MKISATIPDEIGAMLDAEANGALRDRQAQLVFILMERYGKLPRLEDKQRRGSLRK